MKLLSAIPIQRLTSRLVSILLLALFFILGGACNRESADPQVGPLSAREAQTVQHTTDFAFEAFRRLNTLKSSEKNQFISPFSIAMAVAMTANGADGSTKAGIYQTLGMQGPTDEQINQSFGSLSRYLNGIDPKVRFEPANSIWYRNTHTAQSAFVQTNQTYYDALVKGLNFNDAAGSKNTINSWVKEKTQSKIEEIVDDINDNHVMFLINAIYFKGTWTYQFDKALTRPQDFLLDEARGVRKDFMTTQGVMTYLADNEKVLVNVPYGNKQFEMTLIMPQGNGTVDQLITSLNARKLAEWQSQSKTGSVQVIMPKFTFEGDYTEKEFNQVLADMGMNEAFVNSADFSRLLVGVGKGELKIDEVVHKTFVQVDEEGTEAAAVTSAGIVLVSSAGGPIGPPQFIFNRPFVYMIREKNSGAILFMGKMMNPTVEK